MHIKIYFNASQYQDYRLPEIRLTKKNKEKIIEYLIEELEYKSLENIISFRGATIRRAPKKETEKLIELGYYDEIPYLNI